MKTFINSLAFASCMKVPKQVRRHCPSCRKHTQHKVTQNKARGRSSTHPMSRGGPSRVRARGERRGYGNLGRYSRPPKPKMTGKKMTKKTDFRYACGECGRVHTQSSGKRAKKVELV